MLTSVLSFAVATIIVSGYPAIASTTIIRDGIPLARVSSGSFEVRQAAATNYAPSFTKSVWCAKCKSLVPSATAQDTRLGFRGYCGRCVATIAAQCTRRLGRLPDPGEFYCVACLSILPSVELCPPERDGRRRLRCRTCRLNQLRDARKLRRLRGV